MKITRQDLYGRKVEMRSVGEAVEHVVGRASALTDGHLEGIQAELNELTKFVGKLVEVANLHPEVLRQLLGYGFEIEP